MTTKTTAHSQNWKHPDEILKIQRLKQKKKQLSQRFVNSSNCGNIENDKSSLLEAKIAQKRKNPFAKQTENVKRTKTDIEQFEPEDSLLGFINQTPTPAPLTKQKSAPEICTKLKLEPFNPKEFSKIYSQPTAAPESDDEDPLLEKQQFTKHLPMDWSLKTRVRLFARNEMPATTLKTSQMASGLTSFVRCLDTQNSQNACSSLDISQATRFNQATYYWQHPYLPWLTLYPRNSKDNSGIAIGERERKMLAEDWDASFRGLFQLLRARQCPYFYLCANSFTVLFRAAGTGGRVETHALMTPSTHGIRSALRQEGIEYSMPLKKDYGLNTSGDSSFNSENTLAGSEINDPRDASNMKDENLEENDDEQEEDEWLESLGVDEKEIRRIQTAHTRKLKAQQLSDDFSEASLLLIEGVECQGFFSFLLNAKSTIASVGRLAGVPPTLLSPVAFPKATMQQLATRSSKVRMDGVDYNSVEVKGVVLPTFLPYVFNLLSETKDNFSATLASSVPTLAFSKVTKKLIEMENSTKQDEFINEETAGHVFGKENLSDCGLLPVVIEGMCRTGINAANLYERVCYDKEKGYAWS